MKKSARRRPDEAKMGGGGSTDGKRRRSGAGKRRDSTMRWLFRNPPSKGSEPVDRAPTSDCKTHTRRRRRIEKKKKKDSTAEEGEREDNWPAERAKRERKERAGW